MVGPIGSKPWPELYEITLRKVRPGLKHNELDEFRKWFMERENLGFLFDHKLILRAFRIWKELKTSLDHFVVVSGREGTGKTTLAIQLAAWVNPNFTLNTVVDSAEGFIKILKQRSDQYDKTPDDTQSMVMDEGTELLSRDAQNLTNKVLVKTFFIQRALRFLVIICIPNFHMLDSVVRHHRVRTLIEVLQRGKYKAITGKGIKIIAKQGALTKTVTTIKLSDQFFWHGYFSKEFPKTISYDEYIKKKYKGINKTLDNLQDDLSKLKMISARRVAREIGADAETIITLIKKGKVEGKQIGSKWYLTKKAYDLLMNP